MASYCTPNDVRSAFPKALTSGLSPEEVAYLCERWSAFVDGYLAARYLTPIVNPPPLLAMLTTELVWLDILDRQPKAADFVVRRRRQLQDTLEAYARGELVLPGTENRTDIGVVQVSTSGYVPVFGGVPSLGERYDPQRALDEDTERTP